MKITNMLLASAVLALGCSAPAYSQSHNGKMHGSSTAEMMSKSDMNAMMSCKRMSKTAMMKNKRCADMMKMHPSMMNMSKADMMKMSSCMKMSKASMMKDKRCASMMEMHHADMMKGR